VRRLADGRLLIVEPICGPEDRPPANCGDAPHVLWYCMESGNFCSGGANCPFAPYKTPPTPVSPGYPNPNRPSTTHHNVTRHWAVNPTYYVYVYDQTNGGGESAMAELYPVTNPWSTPDELLLLPLINSFARIEGAVQADSFLTFGYNVFPLASNAQPVSSPMGAPAVGRMAGTARLSGSSVVGRTDTMTRAAGTGEFRMAGVPPSQAGQTYQLRIEPPESLGFNTNPALGGAPTWAEWFYDPVYNASLNLPFTVSSLPPSLPAGQSALRIMSCVPFPGSSLGSLHVVPGSVIQITANIELPGPNANPDPPFGVAMTESVTRPVVSIDFRNGRPPNYGPGGQDLVTATVTHDYELDWNSATWQVVGGTMVPGGPPNQTSQPSPIAAGGQPWTSKWNIPLYSLLGPGGTGTVRFTVKEKPHDPSISPPPGYLPPAGIAAVPGINEVRY